MAVSWPLYKHNAIIKVFFNHSDDTNLTFSKINSPLYDLIYFYICDLNRTVHTGARLCISEHPQSWQETNTIQKPHGTTASIFGKLQAA